MSFAVPRWLTMHALGNRPNGLAASRPTTDDDVHYVYALARSLFLADFPLHRYPHDFLLPRVWDLRSNRTAYHAVYITLAEALDTPLLTRDRRLAAAPGHSARVELV